VNSLAAAPSRFRTTSKNSILLDPRTPEIHFPRLRIANSLAFPSPCRDRSCHNFPIQPQHHRASRNQIRPSPGPINCEGNNVRRMGEPCVTTDKADEMSSSWVSRVEEIQTHDANTSRRRFTDGAASRNKPNPVTPKLLPAPQPLRVFRPLIVPNMKCQMKLAGSRKVHMKPLASRSGFC